MPCFASANVKTTKITIINIYLTRSIQVKICVDLVIASRIYFNSEPVLNYKITDDFYIIRLITILHVVYILDSEDN